MATKIVTKNSSTASAVPTASDLVQGELAVNVADKRLFTENNAGAIVELGTNPYNFTANHNGAAKLSTTATGIDVTGTATMDGLTVAGANGNLVLGTSGNDITFSRNSDNYITASGGTSSNIVINPQNRFVVNTNNTERMRIDSAGNVGIGTSSPNSYAGQTTLNINSAGVARLDLDIGDTMQGYLLAESGYTGLFTPSGSNSLRFGTNSAERMRIDSSGNVIVGTTNLAPVSNNVQGVSIRSFGELQSSRDGAATLYLNRKTNDGDIVILRKDGADVGSIGVEGSDLTIGTGDTGLQFRDASDAIRPFNISTNSARDASIDLGRSSERFRDLYLSGGVYLGGTGAANKLDDYEEGTFTPTLIATGYTFAYTAQTGIYTKIGNMVSVKLYLRLSATPTGSGTVPLYLGSLPFTSAGGNASYSAGSILVEGSDNLFTGVPVIRSNPSVTYLTIYDAIAGSSPTGLIDCSRLDSVDEFEISIVYHTA